MPSPFKAKAEELRESIDLVALDHIIDSYDYDSDPLLTQYFRPIEEKLWHRIESYSAHNKYGLIVADHLRRVSQDGFEFLTNTLGFSKKAAINFHAANLFHDIGKTHDDYDEGIWDLPHRPTDEERAAKRLHTIRGAEVFLEAIQDLPQEVQDHPHLSVVIPALQIFHHERIDGTGYAGRNEKTMGTLIRALCIVDCKDGDLVKRGHHVSQRTEKEALLRMTGHCDYDCTHKYEGAFDDLLEKYIAYREEKTGESILDKATEDA
ncbi:MAG: hypothetical protein AAF988_07500 [Pseudomonadota bacterium]